MLLMRDRELEVVDRITEGYRIMREALKRIQEVETDSYEEDVAQMKLIANEFEFSKY